MKKVTFFYILLLLLSKSLTAQSGKNLTNDEKWQLLSQLNKFAGEPPVAHKGFIKEQIDNSIKPAKFNLDQFMKIFRKNEHKGLIDEMKIFDKTGISGIWPEELIDYLFDNLMANLMEYKFVFTEVETINNNKITLEADTLLFSATTVNNKQTNNLPYQGYRIPFEGNIQEVKKVKGELVIAYPDKMLTYEIKANNNVKDKGIIKDISINNNWVSFQLKTKALTFFSIKAYNSKGLPLKRKEYYNNFSFLHFARDKNGDLIKSKELPSKADDVIQQITLFKAFSYDEVKEQDYVITTSFQGKIDHIVIEIPEIKVVKIPFEISNIISSKEDK